MEPVAYDDFAARPEHWDAAVSSTEGIDRYCSSSAWCLSAHESLMPEREPLVLRGDAGWVALARGEALPGRFYLQALEAMWGFASPLAGADVEALSQELFGALRRDSRWDVLMLSGLPADADRLAPLLRAVPPGARVAVGDPTRRRRADLAAGYEGWLGRRSRGFRRNLERAERALASEPIRFEPVGPHAAADSVLARVLAVELRSWKGVAGEGIESGGMRAFYERMVPRLMRRGGLRAIFARDGSQDVAYHFGGVFGEVYRGLQHSYDQRWARFSLGTVLHARMVRAVAEEGLGVYDLGQDIAYKERWADGCLDTLTVYVARARR